MPIRPENLLRYPPDWPAIRLRALTRARYRCQHPGCTARQYAVGHWVRFGEEPWQWRQVEGNTPSTTAQDREFHHAGHGQYPSGSPWSYSDARAFIKRWTWVDGLTEILPIVIVLTIAHLDHQPENCADDNLRAMCQRHHLAHDVEHHKTTAYMTRRAARGNLELFT